MGNVQEQLMAFVCFVILCGCLWLFAMMILAVFFKRNEACEPEKINSPDYPAEVDIIQAEIASLKKRQESGTLGGGVGSLYRDNPMFLDDTDSIPVGPATGKHLSKWGDLYGCPREPGESDDQLRNRILYVMSIKAEA